MLMSDRFRRYSSSVIGGMCLAGLTLACGPAHAGFFDQLFGGAPQPQPQPYYNEPPSQNEFLATPSETPRVAKKVAREATPMRQKTTDLMHDKTLRPGDAVMMKTGMHVYNGPEAAKHSARQFVPVDDARSVSSSQRAALVAMDMTRRGLLERSDQDKMASGRSAAVGVPVTKGFRITDARGASIRYVGP